MSDTHTSGRIVPNSAVTTVLPRLGWMTCSTARVPMNTHSHQFLPLTRTDVSSEQTTGLAERGESLIAARLMERCLFELERELDMRPVRQASYDIRRVVAEIA